MAEYTVGEAFQPRRRQLDNPALATKMVQRSISREAVIQVLAGNEVIEVYEHEDRVRYLLLGCVDERPLHVVVAQDDVIDATVVLSVYEPDEAHGWDARSGFRRRKEDPNEQ